MDPTLISTGETLKTLLTIAWLLPLFGFVVELIWGGWFWGRYSKNAAYLAVLCIGTGFVCSFAALMIWGDATNWNALKDHGHGAAHGAVDAHGKPATAGAHAPAGEHQPNATHPAPAHTDAAHKDAAPHDDKAEDAKKEVLAHQPDAPAEGLKEVKAEAHAAEAAHPPKVV